MKELIRDMVARMRQELDKVTWYEIRSELGDQERRALYAVYIGLGALSVHDPAEWKQFDEAVEQYLTGKLSG